MCLEEGLGGLCADHRSPTEDEHRGRTHPVLDPKVFISRDLLGRLRRVHLGGETIGVHPDLARQRDEVLHHWHGLVGPLGAERALVVREDDQSDGSIDGARSERIIGVPAFDVGVVALLLRHRALAGRATRA